MPSGRPSSSSHISVTRAASGPGSQPGRTARARRRTGAWMRPPVPVTCHRPRRRAPRGPRRRPRLADGQRVDRVLLLAGDPQRRTAGDDEPRRRETRRSAETSPAASRTCSKLSSTSSIDRPARKPGSASAAGRADPSKPQRPRDLGADRPWVRDRVERDEPPAVRCRAGKVACQLDGQARLADPAAPGQGHEPASRSSSRSSSISRARPTKLVSRSGILPTAVPATRSAGNRSACPGRPPGTAARAVARP